MCSGFLGVLPDCAKRADLSNGAKVQKYSGAAYICFGQFSREAKLSPCLVRLSCGMDLSGGLLQETEGVEYVAGSDGEVHVPVILPGACSHEAWQSDGEAIVLPLKVCTGVHILKSGVFPVAEDGPCPGQRGIGEQGPEVGVKVVQGASLEVEHTHHFDEVAQRVDPGDGLGPRGHT